MTKTLFSFICYILVTKSSQKTHMNNVSDSDSLECLKRKNQKFSHSGEV